jgi:hypothetical protein
MRRLLVILVGVLAAAAVWAPGAGAQDPVIAAAGDIACDPEDPRNATADLCHQRATSDLLVGAGLAAVLPLGDLQYGASLAKILQAYDPTWGRVKSISRPVLGNHEGNWQPYFDYFNGMGATDGPAGVRGKGWYSFDVGAWHLVALNSNCTRPAETRQAVDCGVGSEQERWLRADLAAHPTSCTLAYWHHPRYSSGHDHSNTFTQPLWEALADFNVEIVLSGHSHNYERFAPLDRGGNLDPVNGIRQFVVGTGGAFFTGMSSPIAHSEVAQNDTFGVLFLALHPTSYDWRFVPEAGKTFTDVGSTPCHGLIAPPPPVPNPVTPMPTGSRPDSRRPRRPVRVTLRVSDTSPRRGRRVRFYGRVRPAAVGSVRLQRRSRGEFKTVIRARLRHSAFSRRVRPRPGRYRAMYRGAVSRVRRVVPKAR